MQLHRLHEEGHLHLSVAPENFELLRGKNSLTSLYLWHGVAQHTFCSHCGVHAFYVPRSQPDSITVNARCLDDIDGPSLKPTRFFDGRHWEDAQRKRIAEGGHVAAAGLSGAVTLKSILERALEQKDAARALHPGTHEGYVDWERSEAIRRMIVARLRAISPVVIPNANYLRNAEHRELYLSGLRLAAGKAT